MKIDYEKLKRERDKKHKVMETDRFQNILYFFNQKGLLKLAEKPKIIRNQKIDILDILWAKKYEPRILEVFPAAFIHFKRKFKNEEKIPKDLKIVIKNIQAGKDEGPDIDGIHYKDMQRWCNTGLKDKRTAPLNKHKKLVTYKFSREVIEKLDCLSKKSGLTKTDILQKLVNRTDVESLA